MAIAGVATSAVGASELWQFMVDMNPDAASLPELEPLRHPLWLALTLLPEFVATANSPMFVHFSTLH